MTRQENTDKPITYRIANWDQHFENNRTRVLDRLSWIPVPNKHDGEGFLTIMSEKDGLKIYGAWHLILQVASKCHPRGTLVRDDGTPHTPKSISIKAGRCPEADIRRALEFCSSQIDWIEEVTTDVTPVRQSNDAQVPDKRQRREGKGREGNRIERRERETDTPAPFEIIMLSNAEYIRAIAAEIDVAVPAKMAEDCCNYYRARNWMDKNKRPVAETLEAFKSLLRRWRDTQDKFDGGNKRDANPPTPRKKTFEDHVFELSHRLWDQRNAPGLFNATVKSWTEKTKDMPKRNGTTIVEEALEIIEHKREQEKVGK